MIAPAIVSADTKYSPNWDAERWRCLQSARSQDQPNRRSKNISMAGQSPEEERDYRERFFREPKRRPPVAIPGIVTIFDGRRERDARPFIGHAICWGRTLDKLLSKNDRKLPVKTPCSWRRTREALDCAHRQSVVHRDLKPRTS